MHSKIKKKFLFSSSCSKMEWDLFCQLKQQKQVDNIRSNSTQDIDYQSKKTAFYEIGNQWLTPSDSTRSLFRESFQDKVQEDRPKGRTVDFWNWGDLTMIPGKPWQQEFTEQRTRQERAAKRYLIFGSSPEYEAGFWSVHVPGDITWGQQTNTIKDEKEQWLISHRAKKSDCSLQRELKSS